MQKCPHAGTPPIALFIVQECCIVFGVVTDTAFKTTGSSEIAEIIYIELVPLILGPTHSHFGARQPLDPMMCFYS
jgi:hypothetical protein